MTFSFSSPEDDFYSKTLAFYYSKNGKMYTNIRLLLIVLCRWARMKKWVWSYLGWWTWRRSFLKTKKKIALNTCRLVMDFQNLNLILQDYSVRPLSFILGDGLLKWSNIYYTILEIIKAQCLWDLATKMNSGLDSTNVLVSNLKSLYW